MIFVIISFNDAKYNYIVLRNIAKVMLYQRPHLNRDTYLLNLKLKKKIIKLSCVYNC